MYRLRHYTVVTINRQAEPFQTRWYNPVAAKKFAERRYAWRSVRTVAIFVGDHHENMLDPAYPPIMRPQVLLYKSKSA
jgi:hypothetical protein